jgi:hypothetical protein
MCGTSNYVQYLGISLDASSALSDYQDSPLKVSLDLLLELKVRRSPDFAEFLPRSTYSDPPSAADGRKIAPGLIFIEMRHTARGALREKVKDHNKLVCLRRFK